MKKIIIGLMIFVLLVIATVVGFAMLVDPNSFKPLIAKHVNEATDRNLVIAGDLSWTFWPRLGIAMGAVELGNPPGMEEHPPLVAVSSAELSLDVMPLFKKRLHVGEIVLHDPAVYLLTLEDGRSNLDGLTNEPAPQAEEREPDSPVPSDPREVETASASDWVVMLEGVRIANAQVRIEDRQAGTNADIRDLNLTLSRFVLGQWVSVSLESKADIDQISTVNALEAEARLSEDFKALDLREFAVEILAQGQEIPGGKKVISVQGEGRLDLEGRDLVVNPLLISVDDLGLVGDLRVDYSGKPDIVAAFTADTLDLTPFFQELKEPQTDNDNSNANANANIGPANSRPEVAEDEKSGPGATSAETNDVKPRSKEEPDLSGLQVVNAQLSLNVVTLVADKIQFRDSHLALSLQDGQLTIQDLITHAFDGQINLSALLDGRVAAASYVVDLKVDGVEAQEALIALAQTNILSGTAEVTAELHGTGLSEYAIMHGLRGNLALNFADGALWGANIPLEVRRVHALIRGRTIEESDVVQKTDFTSLSGSFQIGDAKAVTRDLAMASPLLRMNGQGLLDFSTETLDMALDVGVVGTLEGQYGKDWEELQGMTIPLRISGPLAEPDFALNVDDVLRQRAGQEAEKLKDKAEKEIERTLRKQLGDDAEEGLGGLLKKLF